MPTVDPTSASSVSKAQTENPAKTFSTTPKALITSKPSSSQDTKGQATPEFEAAKDVPKRSRLKWVDPPPRLRTSNPRKRKKHSPLDIDSSSASDLESSSDPDSSPNVDIDWGSNPDPKVQLQNEWLVRKVPQSQPKPKKSRRSSKRSQKKNRVDGKTVEPGEHGNRSMGLKEQVTLQNSIPTTFQHKSDKKRKRAHDVSLEGVESSVTVPRKNPKVGDGESMQEDTESNFFSL